MAQCTSCSSQVPDGARFCASCGAALDAAPGPTRELPATEAAAPTHPGEPSSVHGRFLPGATLGKRYRIVGLLGRGGMGEVYRADDLELGQSVALKFLPQKLAADPVALDRIRSEVRTARQIAHPNVCRVYDIAQADGHVFLSMEYVDGDDLSQVLRRLGPPSKGKAVEIARQICLGLAAAHENNVLHRDLKPANVMLDGRGRVRITDFGLAGLADELEANPQRAGTPAYMSPEQLESGKVSVRSDIYSLGLLLYELFTGKRAFEGTTLEELKSSRTTGSIPSMHSQDEPVDPAIERVILRCLEPDPADRPPSVYAVLGALPGGDPLAAALAAGETPSPELVANARDAGGLRPPIAIGMLVAALAFLTITYFVVAGSTVMPERAPAVLSVVAEQVMEELGYVDLPSNSVAGYDVNGSLSDSVLSAPRPYTELEALDRPPRFRYWRRWTRGEFLTGYHSPEIFSVRGPTTTEGTTATVELDSTGRLLGLLVHPDLIPESPEPIADVDWSPVFRLAKLDEALATEFPPSLCPIACTEIAAWRMDGWDVDGGPVEIRMGAVRGRPAYFEIVGLDETMEWTGGFPFITTFALMPVRQSILFVMIILALRNWRAGRGDRRNAFRSGLIIGGLYTLMELLSLPFGGPIGLGRIMDFSAGRGIGHIILHTLEGWIFYMAVEPYVRRVWPRMLVGLVRLLSGRWRNPAVGREVLIGVVTGCGLVAVLALMSASDGKFQTQGNGYLPQWNWLWSALSPLHYLSMKAHRAAWACMDAAFIAGLLIAIRLLTRHTLAATVLGIMVLGITGSNVGFMSGSGMSPWIILTYSVGCCTAIVLLYTRVGVLAGVVASFVLRPYELLTTDLDAWFTPYGITDITILLALAAYGCWVALAGRPIFKDMLAEPQAEG